MQLFKNLKPEILKSISTWSAMGKQTAQAKEVYRLQNNETPYKPTESTVTDPQHSFNAFVEKFRNLDF